MSQPSGTRTDRFRLRESPSRQLGRHYTPADLARQIVRTALSAVETSDAPDNCRVLDPACGEGAFLIEVFDELCARREHEDWRKGDELHGKAFSTELPGKEVGRTDVARFRGLTPPARLAVLREHVFGVDIDPAAVATLRRVLLERIGMTGAGTRTAENVVAENIRVGDALREDTFPAAIGRFDLVIGNPPYLRERDARELFASLAETELGKRWREARMDLWHYFVHRSLDLLRPGGVLSFVVNSYWTASRGASRLIGRLQTETRFEEIELFGDRPLFNGVAGRHMVFRVRKVGQSVVGGVSESAPFLLPPTPEGARKSAPVAVGLNVQGCRIILHPAQRSAEDRGDDAGRSSPLAQEFILPHTELFQCGRLVLSLPDRLHAVRQRSRPLSDLFETRQGIAENPPTISRRLEREFPGQFSVGDGVFVLSQREVDGLGLTAHERTVLRPYFDTCTVDRYRLPTEPTHQILYLNRTTAPTLDGFPNVARHLQRFRQILERRRETRLGKVAWWHLHWPREEAIFTRPRILSVQMGRRPQFTYAECPTFVGFAINLVLSRAPNALSLTALTGLLNSNLAAEWFERHAKRRGVHLDINAYVLREFPVPEPNAEIEAAMTGLVLKRQQCGEDPASVHSLESAVECLAERWYQIPVGERGASAP